MQPMWPLHQPMHPRVSFPPVTSVTFAFALRLQVPDERALLLLEVAEIRLRTNDRALPLVQVADLNGLITQEQERALPLVVEVSDRGPQHERALPLADSGRAPGPQDDERALPCVGDITVAERALPVGDMQVAHGVTERAMRRATGASGRGNVVRHSTINASAGNTPIRIRVLPLVTNTTRCSHRHCMW